MPSLVDLAGMARMLIAIVLIAAVVFKLFDRRGLRTMLRDLAVPDRVLDAGVAAVIATELIVAAALLAAPPMVAGIATTTLFLGFAVVVFLKRNQTSGCGCFGKLTPSRKSVAAEESPRVAGAVGGVLIALEGSAFGWFNQTTIGWTLAVMAAYVTTAAVRRALARPGETRAPVPTAMPVPVEMGFDSALPMAAPATKAGVERRRFLAAVTGAPAALLIPGVGIAADRRHCGAGCPAGQRCHCCYHADDDGPVTTCACWPQESPLQPPECRPICCTQGCCDTDNYLCGSDCAARFESCALECESLCGTDESCSLCYAICTIDDALCEMACERSLFICYMSAKLCTSEGPAATPAGAAR